MTTTAWRIFWPVRPSLPLLRGCCRAPFDEKLSLVSLILSGLETRFSASRRADAAADSCYAFLRETKKAICRDAAELAQEPNCWAQLFDQMTADYEAETQQKADRRSAG